MKYLLALLISFSAIARTLSAPDAKTAAKSAAKHRAENIKQATQKLCDDIHDTINFAIQAGQFSGIVTFTEDKCTDFLKTQCYNRLAKLGYVVVLETVDRQTENEQGLWVPYNNCHMTLSWK